MPKKRKKPSKSSSIDVFQLLMETTEKEKKKHREELLTPLGVSEFFVEGNITINKRTCRGLECKLCIIYCGACVLSCIVDDCIRIERKRENGEVESFSKLKDFMTLQNSIKRLHA